MRILLIVFLILPFFAFAEETTTYTGVSGGLQALNDRLVDFWDFFQTDVPSIFTRFTAWAIEWIGYIKFWLLLESTKFAWAVAKVMIENLTLGSQLASAMSALPNDIKQFGLDSGLWDGMNLLLQALVTRYVLNR